MRIGMAVLLVMFTAVCIEAADRSLSLRSTDRLPEASGAATVERRGGTTELEVELESMKPASLFGGDYNTYVLWVVPPAGRPVNSGELLLDGGSSSLRASAPVSDFAILVTAEPHYLVAAPSAFVVLEHIPEDWESPVHDELIRGVYYFERYSLDNVKKARGKVHSDVRQAYTAVRLAKRAGADALAAEELSLAQQALKRTINLSNERKDRTQIAAQARETIELAIAAQRLAQDRASLDARHDAEGRGGGNHQIGEVRSVREEQSQIDRDRR